MTTGFGRKGVSSAAAMPSSAMPTSGMGVRPVPGGRAEPVRGGEEPMSAQMAAFLAEERARRSQDGGDRQVYAGDIERLPKGRAPSGGDRSMLLAYVLWWFATPFAAHRFYLRATQSAVVMLGLFWGGLALGLATGSGIPAIAIGLWFLWALADLFLIPGLTRRANESAGHVFV